MLSIWADLKFCRLVKSWSQKAYGCVKKRNEATLKHSIISLAWGLIELIFCPVDRFPYG